MGRLKAPFYGPWWPSVEEAGETFLAEWRRMAGLKDHNPAPILQTADRDSDAIGAMPPNAAASGHAITAQREYPDMGDLFADMDNIPTTRDIVVTWYETVAIPVWTEHTVYPPRSVEYAVPRMSHGATRAELRAFDRAREAATGRARMKGVKRTPFTVRPPRAELDAFDAMCETATGAPRKPGTRRMPFVQRARIGNGTQTVQRSRVDSIPCMFRCVAHGCDSSWDYPVESKG